MPVVVEHDTLAFDIGIEITAFVQSLVQLSDTLVYELRPCRYLPCPIGIETAEDSRITRMFVNSHSFLGNDQQIVIAHEIGFYSVFDSLIIIDIGSPRITAVENNHHSVFHFIANQLDELSQISAFGCGQVVERFFHIHKINEFFSKITCPHDIFYYICTGSTYSVMTFP